MYSLLFLTIVSFLLALFLTPFVRNRAQAWGLVDQPDQARKLHSTPIPRLGGVAIVLSYLAAFALLFTTPLQAVSLIEGGLPLALRVAPAMAIIFAIGLWDDIRSLRPWQKFSGQILAATVAYFAGVHVQGFGGYHFPDYLNLPATIFWLVLCTNAVNLIDGVDGLATGIGVFATSTTLLAALLQNNMDLALAVAPLLGCLLGFLRYNFNPATIFLGDSGSLSIGFMLGCCSIIWSQKSATILGMTAPLLALAIPLLDTTLAVGRRFLRGKPLFTADRGHIHHRLLDHGLSPRRVALVIYGICGIFATFAILMMNANMQGLIIILFCGVAWIGIQHLGYVEFGVAGRMFVEGAFRRVIESSSKQFGFHTIDMSIAGRRYEYRNGGCPQRSWQVKIPLSNHEDYIELTREFETVSEHNVVAPYADAVRRAVETKLGFVNRAKAASASI
jgi:UDP-GlcNAc:undecaprenyl-phosphate GlcNAc-1-phosphate transferase